MTGPQSLMIMNRSVPSGTHICAFYSGPAARDDAVMPFLADGADAVPALRDLPYYIDPGEFLRGAE
jgi:hypothetical protein